MQRDSRSKGRRVGQGKGPRPYFEMLMLPCYSTRSDWVRRTRELGKPAKYNFSELICGKSDIQPSSMC